MTKTFFDEISTGDERQRCRTWFGSGTVAFLLRSLPGHRRCRSQGYKYCKSRSDGCKSKAIYFGAVFQISKLLVAAMSNLQRSAMNARLAKLPGYIPNVYTPTIAPGFAAEDENAEELEEAMSSIGQLPTMAPPKVRKYVPDHIKMMLVTDTST